ncbi:hypothetical protein GCM10029992_06380 [Glycomyces albus]
MERAGVLHACYRGSRAQSAVMALTLGVHQGTWRTVDRFVALTDAMAEYLRGIGIESDRIRVKPNAVADPGPMPLGEGFLFAARLVPEKGVELLLDAWREAKLNVPLRIAGDGPLRPLVERAAGADGVEYLGRLDPAERDAALEESAAVVIPSIWRDILPTSGIEALAAGRALVVTDIGGGPFIAGLDTTRPAGHGATPSRGRSPRRSGRSTTWSNATRTTRASGMRRSSPRRGPGPPHRDLRRGASGVSRGRWPRWRPAGRGR